MPVTICLIIFGAHIDILFIIEVKIVMLIKWSYRSPQSCSLLNLEWSVYFEHAVHSHLKTCFLCQFLGPYLTAYHLIIDVQIIVVFDLGMSTLTGSQIV